MSDADVLENAKRIIRIEYTPRAHFRSFHNSTRRHRFVVAHRRAGKSVAIVNELIKKALLNKRQHPPPRYAYVGPSYAQAKDLVWGYLKHFLHPVPGVTFSESELTATLPNGARIGLYGGSTAYERMRGLYHDGIALDEYPLLNPLAWPLVIRPTLSDYMGFAIVSGTPNGQDHFYDQMKKAENDNDWDIFNIPVTQTDALDPDELADMRKDMSADQYAREMLCSFDAPVEGAYYAEHMNEALAAGRICRVPWDPAARVYTSWDLGISDHMSIWFFQQIRAMTHVIDHLSNTGQGLSWYVRQLHERPYIYGGHLLPHDVKARELGTGVTREETLNNMGLDVHVVPMHKVEDRISATRNLIPVCYFDEEKTRKGREALQAYRSGVSQSLGLTRPVHDWASHDADSFGGYAMGKELVAGWSGSAPGKPLIRRLRGLARRIRR